MTVAEPAGVRIAQALQAAGMGQRELSRATDIPQATISRIVTGQRRAKVAEIVAIAEATGRTIAELSGAGGATERVKCVARATGSSDMVTMRSELIHFVELNDYLENQAIPATG